MKEPKIRFKGFEGEWETSIIGDMCSISTGKSNTQDKIEEGKYPFYVRSPFVERSNKFLFDEEAVLTVGDGVGTGKVFHYVNGKYDLHQRVYRMFDFCNIYAKFFYYYFSTKFYKRVMSMTAKSSVDSVRMDMIADMKIDYPSTAEQQSIASYFQHLDSLIQSTTKKIESLKQVKAASLQSMFPQEGETTPRVRFKGFEEEWEIVTLGEVGTFKSNGVDKLIKPNEKIINLLNYLDVYNSRQVTKDNCNSLMQVSASDRQIKECDIQKNDVFFTPSSETAEDIGYVLVMRDTLPNTCYSYHLMRYRPNEGVFFEDFPNCGFMTKFVRAQIRLLAKGVQRFVIGKTEFESIKVQIPSYKEQMQIANFFRSLDRQITLQNQRLEKLKQIKAACLDKMFV